MAALYSSRYLDAALASSDVFFLPSVHLPCKYDVG